METGDTDGMMVECYYNGTKTAISPRRFYSILAGVEYEDRKFVRYKTGAHIYGMSEREFNKLAHAAGAVYKINKMALVNLSVIDNYMEYFKE